MDLLLVADGEIHSSKTNSGVARGISGALQQRTDVVVVGAVNASATGWRRIALLISTFRPSRRSWWANFNFGVLNIALRSCRRDAAARRLANVDFILQIRNIYFPSRFPYLVFIDSTSHTANANWKNWRPSRITRGIRHAIELSQFRRAAHVFTAGSQAARSVVTDYGIPAERVTAVGGGVNFDPLPYPIYGRERPAHKILWIGLDFERKGGDILIEAFQRVRERFLDAELIMVGARSSVEVPGVTYAGIVTSRDELAKFYLDATIFCLPARHEPYGLVVQEAMAFGLPCIATRVGALDEIIDDAVTGRIVAAENVDELADELLVLLDDPDRCDQMGRAGRVKVENSLTWASVAERMINTLTQPAIEPTDK